MGYPTCSDPYTVYTMDVFVFGHPIFMGVPAFAISTSGFSWSCGSSGGQFCSQLLLQSVDFVLPPQCEWIEDYCGANTFNTKTKNHPSGVNGETSRLCAFSWGTWGGIWRGWDLRNPRQGFLLPSWVDWVSDGLRVPQILMKPLGGWTHLGTLLVGTDVAEVEAVSPGWTSTVTLNPLHGKNITRLLA